MKIELTNEKLSVGKYLCNSVTIVKEHENFTATLFLKETYRKALRTKWHGVVKTDLSKRLTLKFKRFDYSGLALKDVGIGTVSHLGFTKYLYAKNSREEYLNYYEKN